MYPVIKPVDLKGWAVPKLGDEPYTLVEIAHIKRIRYNDIIEFVKQHGIKPYDYFRTQRGQDPKFLFHLEDFSALDTSTTVWTNNRIAKEVT